MLKSPSVNISLLKIFLAGAAAACLALRAGGALAAPISSLNIVFNATDKNFTAGVTTNTAGNGQVWVQAFTSPDAGATINIELLDNGVVVPNGVSPASLTTQAGVVTYGFPNTTPVPFVFFRAGTGLTLRATVSGSTVTRESATFTVQTASATKLIVLAPGETHAPGTNPSLTTGKTGSVTTQTPNQPFALTAILTDNSFNKVLSSTHVVSFTSGDLTTLPAGGALIQGTGDFNATITGARTSRTFTVTDASDASVLSGSVLVQTSGPPEQEVFPFPSPFNPNQGQSMKFRFHRNDSGNATVKVKDQFGQSIWERSLGSSSGFTDVSWDGRNEEGVTVAAGVYYVLLEIDGSVKSKKRFGVTK